MNVVSIMETSTCNGNSMTKHDLVNEDSHRNVDYNRGLFGICVRARKRWMTCLFIPHDKNTHSLEIREAKDGLILFLDKVGLRTPDISTDQIVFLFPFLSLLPTKQEKVRVRYSRLQFKPDLELWVPFIPPLMSTRSSRMPFKRFYRKTVIKR